MISRPLKKASLLTALSALLCIQSPAQAESFPIKEQCSLTLKLTPMTNESLKPYLKKGSKLLISSIAEDSVLGVVYGASIITPEGNLLIAESLMADWVSPSCTKEQLSKEKAQGFFLKATTIKEGPFGFRPLCKVPAQTRAKVMMIDKTTFQFIENIEGCEADLTKEPVKVNDSLLITYPQ